MKILVTGGAGFIGSHVVQALQQDHEVVIIDDLNDYYDPAYKQANLDLLSPLAFYHIDVINEPALREVFEAHQFDTIVHLAARAGVRPSIESPQLYAHVNLLGTTLLAQLAAEYNVPHFVFGSTSAVYGNNSAIPFSEDQPVMEPISPYAASKRGAELMLYTYHELYKTKTTILRFFTVYGERGRPDMAPYLFTKAILNGETIRKFGDGHTSRDYTYIADIVQGVVAAVNTPQEYEIVNLGNHTPVTLNEFISTIEQACDKQAIIEEVEEQPGDVQHTYANIEKAKSLFNFEPTTSLAEGMEKFVTWFKTNRS